MITTVLFAAGEPIVLDSAFFQKFSTIHPIEKDTFFNNMVNNVIIGRGKILSVSFIQRYKKKYRIVIESAESSRYNNKILYYVFLDNKNTTDILEINSTFEFKGQLAGFTPLNTKRNEYILDVIFIEGSTIIE
jgi:hypothetical protein